MEASQLIPFLTPLGVSGEEHTAFAAITPLLTPLGRVEETPLQSLLCHLPPKKENLPRVLLAAHLDRIGLMVSAITETGLLETVPCGGPDRRSLAAARVTVQTDTGLLPGVLVPQPSEEHQPMKTDTAKITLGLPAETVRSLVQPGDRISFDGELTPLLGDRVTGAALDDRAGCAAIWRAGQLLADCDTAAVTLAFLSQEEVGSAGGRTVAAALSPDIAFAVDVSFADTPDDTESGCGRLGGGPMIGFAPILDRRLSRGLQQIAAAESIPCQTEVMAGRTGTDADQIAIAGGGVRTGLVSIPLRFMHTPHEVIACSDVEETARLLAAAVRGAIWND